MINRRLIPKALSQKIIKAFYLKSPTLDWALDASIQQLKNLRIH